MLIIIINIYMYIYICIDINVDIDIDIDIDFEPSRLSKVIDSKYNDIILCSKRINSNVLNIFWILWKALANTLFMHI